MSKERGDMESAKNEDLLITFKIDKDGDLLNAIQISDFIDKVKTLCYLPTAQIMFSKWINYEIYIDDVFLKPMEDLQAAIVAYINNPSTTNDLFAQQSFMRLAREIRAYEINHHTRLNELEFLFAGSYIENPTNFRFIVNGTAVSLLLIVFIFGGIQGKKEWDADACLVRADNIQKEEMKNIHTQIRTEGKMTENHTKSQEITTNSANKMRKMCGSMFHGIEIIVDFSEGFKFIVRSGQQDLDHKSSADRQF